MNNKDGDAGGLLQQKETVCSFPRPILPFFLLEGDVL